MIRILFTIPNFITAGSGGAMLNIVSRLDRRKFEPAVCVLKRGGKLDRVVEEMGIPLLEAPFLVGARPYVTLPARAWEAARVFRPYRFDLWHSFHYGDDYTEPLIAYLAGAKAWVYTKKNMNWRGRAWKVRSFLARGIAAQNSDMLEQFFASRWFHDKTRLIPPGVDMEKFRPQREARLGMRRKLTTPAGARVALAVGHVLPVKGHDLLLEAVRGMDGIEVWIAGSMAGGEYCEKLQGVANSDGLTGKVRFLGAMDDVGALHAEADVYVHPSRQEGCPVALLEAMASGMACIATDVAGCRDVIEDGRSGLLVRALDAEALRAAIRRVLSDDGLRRRLGEGARRRIEEQYSIEREVARHEEMYRTVLEIDRLDSVFQQILTFPKAL
ncbi:MAG: glycosyltransferase family 4 protein [Acidobacteriota bacterium]